MKKPKVIDRRHIHLEDVLKADYIPFLGGRPSRDTVIGREDVLNLKIALHTSHSVEEFMGKM